MTHLQVSAALARRDVGARLAQGPWRLVDAGRGVVRYSVPAVTYMSLEPLGELEVQLVSGQVEVLRKKRAERHEDVDPVGRWR